MTAGSHSLCAHVAGNSQIPLACITTNGRESFYCGGCSAEIVSSMIGKHSPAEIVGALSFRRCNHGIDAESDFCFVCFYGVTLFLESVAWYSMFTDRQFANRLRKIVEKLSIANGLQKRYRKRHSQFEL